MLLTASHIATALCAAAGRLDGPSDRLPTGAFGYWGVSGSSKRSGNRSHLKQQ